MFFRLLFSHLSGLCCIKVCHYMTEKFTLSLSRSIEKLDSFRIEFSLRLETAGVDEDTISQFELCTYEVLVNIIEHSEQTFDEPITITCTINDELVTASLTYKGDRFDPTNQELPDIQDHFSTGKNRGLGIYIIHTLMDTLSFSDSEGTSTLTMKKHR